MRLFSCRGLLCLLAVVPFTGSLAAPSKPCAHKLKETVNPPRGWTKYGIPPADHSITLRIGLPQPNFHLLESHLYEVSDPDHPRYGAHLSKEEVEELVTPHQTSVDAVTSWLKAHNIKETDIVRSPAKDWITLTIPVKLVEEMLDTTYHIWKHDVTGDRIVRTTSWSVPEDVHEHIDVIQPTTMFGQFKRLRSTIVFADDTPDPEQFKNLAQIQNPATGVPIDPSCNVTITIKCLQQLYNTVGFVPKAKNNSIGITGYLEEFANIQDLQSFYREQRPDAVGSKFKFLSVKGGLNDQNLSQAGAEAGLDVQFAFGLSFPIPGTFWSTAGRPPFIPDVRTPNNTNEPYLDWLDFVNRQKNVPLSISTSYGDDEQTVPKDYAKRVCKEFAQLGARGVSLMFSSGDGGVGDNNANPATQTCFTNDGRNVTRFIPLFPASCPFVTSVGGTQNINPEVAVSRFFSGGGFSDYFVRPPYQEKAVGAFIDSLPKDLYRGLFNRNGRGIPDVAAQGDRFRIFLSGVPRSIGGTSASSPTFAGIVALLNDVRLSRGRPPLGFLNPLVYKLAGRGFTDITSGHNPGCGTNGFNCTKGWDPVTGFGTPNFGKLKDLVLQE